MLITDLQKEAGRIVRREMEKTRLADNWIHGLRHVDRVLDNWGLLTATCPFIGERLAKMLMVAAYFHDAKRGDEGEYGDHAKAGAAFFRRQTLAGISAQESEMIAFAIEYHNVGLTGLGLEADSERNILLQLLCVIDGLDALCYVGYFRVLGWYAEKGKEYDVLSARSADELAGILAGSLTGPELDALHLKNEGSVLDHLIYDYLIFDEILSPVRSLLAAEFIATVEKRKGKLRKMIDYRIKMRQRNEKPLKHFL